MTTSKQGAGAGNRRHVRKPVRPVRGRNATSLLALEFRDGDSPGYCNKAHIIAAIRVKSTRRAS